ncbi:MAG: T9SS type A sorting domain-containing protein, partial [Flavobacteriales bacterium]
LLQLNIQAGGTVGIEDGLDLANISIHPNPAQDRFVIDLGGFHGSTEAVQLIDAQGRMIMDKAILQGTGARAEVDVSAIPVGVYIVHLLTDKGVWNERLIITR